MRARISAAVVLGAAAILALSSAGAGLAQTPPPVIIVPDQAPVAPNGNGNGAPPAPPPTVLLPPSSSEAAVSDAAPAKPVAPLKRPRRTAAIIQALDKTTAETLRFEAPIGQPIRYKDLIFVVHACEDSAPELGQRGAAAHMEIQSSPRPLPGRVAPPSRQLFKGWMFADAPGLHPFEHPVYDAWLLGCRGIAAAAPAVAPPPAPPPPKPAG
ncbi:MAG: DUF2155 domain-containing protein [Phenylobacterium sp.]